MDFEDRYVYWRWNGWEFGLMKLFFATVFYYYFLNPNNLWIIGSKRLETNEIGLHMGVAFILISYGNIGANSLIPYFVGIIPYLLAFLSCLLVFQFSLTLDHEKGTWQCFEWKKVKQHFSLSLFLMILSVLLGIQLDDPIMSTAGAVSVAFSFGWANMAKSCKTFTKGTVFPIIYFFYVLMCKSTMVFDTYSYLIFCDKNNKLFPFWNCVSILWRRLFGRIRMYDLIIVGAGPAGTTAALYADRNNLSCIVLDKAIFPRDKICGDALSGKSVRILEELNLTPEIEQLDGAEINRITFGGPNHNHFDVHLKGNKKNNYITKGYVIPRKIFDYFLFKKAKEVTEILDGF